MQKYFKLLPVALFVPTLVFAQALQGQGAPATGAQAPQGAPAAPAPTAAGIPILHMPAQKRYSALKLREQVLDFLESDGPTLADRHS